MIVGQVVAGAIGVLFERCAHCGLIRKRHPMPREKCPGRETTFQSTHDSIEEELDNVDADKCVQCGVYYSMSERLVEIWRETRVPREGEIMPQLCAKCMRGENDY